MYNNSEVSMIMNSNQKTSQLEDALLKAGSSKEFLARYDDCFVDQPAHKMLAMLCKKYGIKKSQAIAASFIPRSYAYQIFSGFKRPSRDRVIMLGFGIGVSLDDLQMLLAVSGHRRLYVKDKRDAVIYMALHNSRKLLHLNFELDALYLKPLT